MHGGRVRMRRHSCTIISGTLYNPDTQTPSINTVLSIINSRPVSLHTSFLLRTCSHSWGAVSS